MVGYDHKHEINMDKAEFVPGVGFKGLCKVCGTPIVYRRVMRPLNAAQAAQRAGTRVRMSKKERLKAKREAEAKNGK